MKLPVGAADWSHSRRVGSFMEALTRDHDWILRRVESIHFLDSVRLERRITLDLDIHEIRRRATANRIQHARVPVPLMMLVKNPILDVDVKGMDSESMALATRDQNSHLSSASLLAILKRNGFRPRRLPAEVLEQLYSIVRDRSSDYLIKVLYAVAPGSFDDRPRTAGHLDLKDDELLAWENMLDVGPFVDALFDFASSYTLVGQVDLSKNHDVAIIKIRLVEERSTDREQSSWRSPDRLGWRPLVQTITLGGLGNAQRGHLRVFAPEEAVIRNARLTRGGTTIDNVVDGVRADGTPAPLDRVVFYQDRLPPATYELRVDMEPSRSAFLIPAAITTGLLSFLLLAATFLQWTESRFSDHPASYTIWPRFDGVWSVDAIASNQANFDAAVTVLALVPSLVAIYLVRTGEHRLVTRLMFLPRLFVLASALTAIVAAGATAASIEPARLGWVYAIAAFVSVTAFAAVMIPIARISRFRSIRRSRTRT